ncbi:hypothetical protein [Streptomyces xanthochromogenes]|uniref:hypothetical protein n=1 Tax=Streptomyces xanthochromogenes TaxID=67384 RepID=UPI00344884B6
MSAVAASAAVLIPGPRAAGGAVCTTREVLSGERRVRRQRVKVPMRLVWSPFYEDVALSVYVKVKALGSRPEGCQARTETIGSYLGLSDSSVERGLRQLGRPGLDGVVELVTERRTMPGGRGQSAVRRVRSMPPVEAFVWLPVATCEDLTPRQLRVYALVAYAQARGIGVTEAEIASCLRHHSGKRAGTALSVTAASAVVDQVEAARWMTVERRAGERGRHIYRAHDLAPEAREDLVAAWCGSALGTAEAAVVSGPDGVASSQVGEGSGSQVDEGSLANKESPKTDSPEDERGFLAPAVGEVPVVDVESVAGGEAAVAAGECGGALRAGGQTQPALPIPKNRSSRDGAAAKPSYSGPRLAMTATIYAVLEPVHYLLEQVSDFVARKIAREVGRQLDEGTLPERLHHRLTARFAGVMVDEIRDPGRWLLGVALPRWGCGFQDCEAGVIWRTGAACEICAEVVQDKASARRREERLAQGLCPEHGVRPGRSGCCPVCELDTVIAGTVSPLVEVQQVPQGPPRGSCTDCGARIMLIGRSLATGLCKLCRDEREVVEAESAAVPAAGVVGQCAGRDGHETCARAPLPDRSVCVRHLAHELTGAVVA